jgi:hypothetical protein
MEPPESTLTIAVLLLLHVMGDGICPRSSITPSDLTLPSTSDTCAGVNTIAEAVADRVT